MGVVTPNPDVGRLSRRAARREPGALDARAGLDSWRRSLVYHWHQASTPKARWVLRLAMDGSGGSCMTQLQGV